MTVERSDLTGSDPAQVVATLESRINAIAETAAGYRAEELAFRRLGARIDARLAEAFEHQARVDALRTRLRDIEEILTPAGSGAAAETPPVATIRRLPRRPLPDDPTTVTDYDDCPMCLSSDLRSTGDDEADQVRCKECGWVGSYPPRPRLVAVRDPPPPSAVPPDAPSTGTPDHFATGARLTPSSTAGGNTDDPYAPAVGSSGTGTPELGPAPPLGAAAAPLPSIHQEHQLHQQLYPAPQPAPIVIQP